MSNLSTTGMQDVGVNFAVRPVRSGEPGAVRQGAASSPRDSRNVSHLARMMAAARGEARIHSMSPERLAALRASDWSLQGLAQAIVDEVGL